MITEQFKFTPEDGYENKDFFPTDAASETEARKIHNQLVFQIRDYINTTIIPAINALYNQGGE